MYHKESFAAIDDAALRHLGATLPVVRYLVIGANDGLFGDPLIAHTGGANWRGTLFEPVPDSFARLQANYAGRAGARLRRQAVVADAPGGVRTFHSVPTAPVLASFQRDTIESHRKFAGLEDIAAQIVPIEVPCVAVAELVAEADFEPPDVLLTDTEGYDYDLFAAWWPLGWRPAYARIEIAHVCAARYHRGRTCGRRLRAVPLRHRRVRAAPRCLSGRRHARLDAFAGRHECRAQPDGQVGAAARGQAMNPADMQPAIRDAALAKLARARSPAVAMTLTADQMPAPGVLAPDALIVAAGGMAPADWLARGWRPAFVEGAYPEPAGAKAAIDALVAADYECFRDGDVVLALRRADFDPRDMTVLRLLRDQMLAAVALAQMMSGGRP